MQINNSHLLAGFGNLLRRPVLAALALSLAVCVPANAAAAFELPAAYVVDGMKPGVRPGDDFNAYVNGGWADATEIPADKSYWGIDGEMAEATDKRVAQLIEGAAKGGADASADARRVGAFYTAFMDEAGVSKQRAWRRCNRSCTISPQSPTSAAWRVCWGARCVPMSTP